MTLTREEQFRQLFPDAPTYRWRQVEDALFDPALRSFDAITALPKQMRETLAHDMRWLTITPVRMFESARKDTYKAIVQGADGKEFETVLMANKREQWTICVSSQIGCAMRCNFCATGTMGLKRSLSSDEIVDQYRMWRLFLADHPELPTRISNVVFMGMGEPMANYDAVKQAIRTWLAYTDIGPTHITVSSVGIVPQLERILTDADWPHVRIAISLHSANAQLRGEIVPTSIPDFLAKLADWSRRYAVILGNKRHYITYEYVLLQGVNDRPEDAHELAKYIRTTGSSKINVIPWNPVRRKEFSRSHAQRIDAFKSILRDAGLDVTQRKTMGDDIEAACGQLVVEKETASS